MFLSKLDLFIVGNLVENPSRSNYVLQDKVTSGKSWTSFLQLIVPSPYHKITNFRLIDNNLLLFIQMFNHQSVRELFPFKNHNHWNFSRGLRLKLIEMNHTFNSCWQLMWRDLSMRFYKKIYLKIYFFCTFW